MTEPRTEDIRVLRAVDAWNRAHPDDLIWAVKLCELAYPDCKPARRGSPQGMGLVGGCALGRLVRAGLVERVVARSGPYRYRLTAAGASKARKGLEDVCDA